MSLLHKTLDSIVTQSSIGSITYLWCVAWSARESFLSHFYELFMVIPYYDESFSSFYDNLFSLLVFAFRTIFCCFIASVLLKLCSVVLADRWITKNSAKTFYTSMSVKDYHINNIL